MNKNPLRDIPKLSSIVIQRRRSLFDIETLQPVLEVVAVGVRAAIRAARGLVKMSKNEAKFALAHPY
jgi:hypothetical protein